MIRTARWWLLAPMFVVAAVAQDAPPDRPAPRSNVIDSAKLFSPAVVAQSKKRLAAIEEATSVPVTIETVESLHGQSIEDAALKAARLSGGDGLFILIAKDERKIAKPLVRRQFEHRFPEEKKAAIREAILEGFKAGDFGDGLKRGIDAIAATLERPAAPAPTDPAWGLSAPSNTSIVRDQARLTLAGARKVLAAAEAKAIDMKVKANLAVVDDGGHLLAFIRMDGARPASVATAQTKAASAATFRQATGPMSNGSAADASLDLGLALAGAAGGARITPLLGGVPILVDGQVVGAIGVAGGRGDQDAEIARSGIAALTEDVKKPSPEKDAPKP